MAIWLRVAKISSFGYSAVVPRTTRSTASCGKVLPHFGNRISVSRISGGGPKGGSVCREKQASRNGDCLEVGAGSRPFDGSATAWLVGQGVRYLNTADKEGGLAGDSVGASIDCVELQRRILRPAWNQVEVQHGQLTPAIHQPDCGSLLRGGNVVPRTKRLAGQRSQVEPKLLGQDRHRTS